MTSPSVPPTTDDFTILQRMDRINQRSFRMGFGCGLLHLLKGNEPPQDKEAILRLADAEWARQGQPVALKEGER